MTERPMLMSAPMIRALLAGEKTQTRRVVKPQPQNTNNGNGGMTYSERYTDTNGRQTWFRGWGNRDQAFCPYGEPGDRLWVRETWAAPHKADHLKPSEMDDGLRIHYAASEDLGGLIQRPSIFMPRWASRITLEVTGVRVERLQDIARSDAMAEGCPFPNMAKGDDPRQWYARLWDEINGPESWKANPFVWVIEFRRLTP